MQQSVKEYDLSPITSELVLKCCTKSCVTPTSILPRLAYMFHGLFHFPFVNVGVPTLIMEAASFHTFLWL